MAKQHVPQVRDPPSRDRWISAAASKRTQPSPRDRDILYEAKLVYYTPTFEDKVRTFCWNPRGEVVEEKYGEHLSVVNGHSYKDEKLKTTNTNFALLVSKNFTQPFKTPIEYGRYIAEMGNMLSGNKVIVQRYGDFKRGRRSTSERLSKNTIHPTLCDAVPGDLSLVIPYRILLAMWTKPSKCWIRSCLAYPTAAHFSMAWR